jgi:hypothetical protein
MPDAVGNATKGACVSPRTIEVDQILLRFRGSDVEAT